VRPTLSKSIVDRGRSDAPAGRGGNPSIIFSGIGGLYCCHFWYNSTGSSMPSGRLDGSIMCGSRMEYLRKL
jgi:hypothetical protein